MLDNNSLGQGLNKLVVITANWLSEVYTDTWHKNYEIFIV